MQGGYIFLLLLLGSLLSSVSVTIACSPEQPANNQMIFNVRDYGAVNGGKIDNSQAFLEAWNAACNSETEISILIVPQQKFLVYPIIFTGPCKPKIIHFMIFGRVLAPDSPEAWEGLDPSQWLAFSGVSGLKLAGPGSINGRGQGWWDQSCKYHPTLENCTKLAPTAVKFLSCNNSSIREIHFVNSSQTHVTLKGCDGISMDTVRIEAPERSPNTDGIHISDSHNVFITNAIIGTGDDCVSVGDRTSNIVITYVKCGPGHGISIGSLGKSGNFVQVENIHVSNVYLQGTTNGARIKTWQVGRGYVRQVIFENVFFRAVKNPIIIDQNYCSKRGACKERKTGVHISGVLYNNLYGTSSSKVAMNLNCSRSVACTGIIMKSIYLRPAIEGKIVTSNCTNAHGLAFGMVQPEPCIQI